MNENDVLHDIKMYLDTNAKIANRTFDSWYDEELFFQKWERELIGKLSSFLKAKYGNFYNSTNLKKMKKLYLEYPDGLTFPLSTLPWKNIKILVEIFDEEKRDFYIDVCYLFNLSSKKLKYYLLHDLYEKFLYCYFKYYQDIKLNDENYREILKQVMNILDRIV